MGFGGLFPTSVTAFRGFTDGTISTQWKENITRLGTASSSVLGSDVSAEISAATSFAGAALGERETEPGGTASALALPSKSVDVVVVLKCCSL